MIGNFNDETKFLHKLLLNDTQVSKICKDLANSSSANIKFSKTQLSKIIQSGGIIGESVLQAMFLAGREALKSVYQHQNRRKKQQNIISIKE